MHGRKRHHSKKHHGASKKIKAEIRSVIAKVTELKWSSAAPAAAAIDNSTGGGFVGPFIGLHSNLTPGSAFNQRIGNDVAWHDLRFTIIATSQPGALGDTQIRIVIMVDNQWDNAAGASPSDFFPTGTGTADFWRTPFDRNEVGYSGLKGKRYHVKYDKVRTLAPRVVATNTALVPNTTSTLVPDSVFVKHTVKFHGLRTQYNSAGAGTPGDVIDRMIMVFVFCDKPSVFGPTVAVSTNKSFTDV